MEHNNSNTDRQVGKMRLVNSGDIKMEHNNSNLGRQAEQSCENVKGVNKMAHNNSNIARQSKKNYSNSDLKHMTLEQLEQAFEQHKGAYYVPNDELDSHDLYMDYAEQSQNITFFAAVRLARAFHQRSFDEVGTRYVHPTGLTFYFKRHPTYDKPRDTSTRICYNSKPQLKSKTIGNVDHRKPRVRMNTMKQPVTPSLPARTLPPLVFKKKDLNPEAKPFVPAEPLGFWSQDIEDAHLSKDDECYYARLYREEQEEIMRQRLIDSLLRDDIIRGRQNRAQRDEEFTFYGRDDDEELAPKEVIFFTTQGSTDLEETIEKQAKVIDKLVNDNAVCSNIIVEQTKTIDELRNKIVDNDKKEDNSLLSHHVVNITTPPKQQLVGGRFLVESEFRTFVRDLPPCDIVPVTRDTVFIVDGLDVYRWVRLGDTPQGAAVQLWRCRPHRDKQGCMDCKFGKPRAFICPEPTMLDVHYNQRRKIHIKEPALIRTQGLFSSALQSVESALTSLISNIFEYLEGKISSKVRETVLGTYAKTVAAAKELIFGDKLPQIASFVFDIMTDKREISFFVLASYATRMIGLGGGMEFLLRALQSWLSKDVNCDEGEPPHVTVGYSVSTDEVTITSQTYKSFMENKKAQAGLRTQGATDLLDSVWKFCSRFVGQDGLRKLQLFNALPVAYRTLSNLWQWIMNLLPMCIAKYFNTPERIEWRVQSTTEKGAWRSYLILSNEIYTLKVDNKSVGRAQLETWRKLHAYITKVQQDPKYGMEKDQSRIVDFYRREIANMAPNSSEREVEPMWIYLYGESRIGKSACMMDLAANLLGTTREEAAAKVYPWNADSDYFDGYNNEKEIFLIDDLGAKNEPNNPHADMLMLIPMISTVPMMVPMATLDDPTVGKKGTYFTSNTIISCSNAASYSTPELTCPEALLNRRHEVFHVKKRPESQIDLIGFTHLEFHLQMRGTQTRGIICDVDCCKQASTDVLCRNLRASKAVFNFNEFCRYNKLRRRFKLTYAKVVKTSTFCQDSFQSYESRFEHNDEDFERRYIESMTVKTRNEAPTEPFERPTTEPRVTHYRGHQQQSMREFTTPADFNATWLRTEGDELDAITKVPYDFYNLHIDDTREFIELYAFPAQAAINCFLSSGLYYAAYRGLKWSFGDSRIGKFFSYAALFMSILGTVYVGFATYEFYRQVHLSSQTDAEDLVRNYCTESMELGKSRARQAKNPVVIRSRRQAEEEQEDIDDDYTYQEPECSNSVFVHVRPVGKKSFHQNGFVVSGYHLVMTAHMFQRNMAPEMQISIYYKRKNKVFSAVGIYQPQDIHFVDGKDLVEIDLSRMPILPFRDWSSHVPRDGDAMPEVFDGYMTAYRGIDMTPEQFQGRFQMQEERWANDTAVYPPVRYRQTKGYSASFGGRDGYCGAVVFDKQTKIRGMHVASYQATTGSTAISISFTLEDLKLKCPKVVMPDNIISQAAQHPWEDEVVSDCVIPLGRAPKDVTVFQNTKHDIRPSVIHGLIKEPITAPSVLSQDDPRNKSGLSPMLKGATKYLEVPTELNLERLDLFEECVSFYINQYDTGIRPGILTEHQVLNGDPGIPHIKGIDLNTSSGHGYKEPGGKRAHIKLVDGEYRITSPTLRQRLDELESQVQHSVVVQVVQDCLKSERRKHAKIEAGDTRIFNIHTQEFTILCVKYLGKMVAHFMELAKFDSPFCVGIDPFSPEFDAKIRYLIEVGVMGFDGDGVKYDANYLSRAMTVSCFKVFSRWISDDEQMQRAIRNIGLSGETVLHILGSYMFMTFRGTLSGAVVTTMMNSSGMLGLSYLAFYDAVPAQYRNLASFHKHVRLLIFGDDHIITVSPEIREYYNFQTQKAFLTKLGLGYTPGSKVGNETRKFWSVKEMTFLKCHVGRLGHLYVPLLDNSVIWEMTNWITAGQEPTEATLTNVRTAQRFWFFYGKEHFEACMVLIRQHLRHEPLHTYDELARIYRMNNYHWEPEFSFYAAQQTNIERAQADQLIVENRAQHQTKMETTYSNIDRQIKTESAVLDGLAPFAKIIDGIIPHEIQQDALGFLGALDRPTMPDTMAKTRMQFFPNTNAIKGVDTSVPLRIDPSSMTLVDEHHFRRAHEADLKKLWVIPTALPSAEEWQLFEWSTADSVGDTLYFEQVGPNTEFNNFGPGFLAGKVPSLLAYTTKPFMHWRGNIRYEIEVFGAPSFHTGSLRISFFPGVYDVAEVPSEVDKSSQYFAIMNLSEGSHKFHFDIPYISQYPWLEINNDSRTTEQYQRFHTTGIMLVSVAKKLRPTGQAASTINFVIRRAAGPDFAVANMTMHNGSIQLGASPWETVAFVTQSAENSAETDNVARVLGTVGTSTAVLDDNLVTTNATLPTELGSSHPRVQQAVGEKSWDIKEAGNKQTLFYQGDWNDTQVAGTVLGVWDLPNDALVCDLNNIAKNRFVNVRADMTIQMELSSSKFQSGAVALVWMPCVAAANFVIGSVQNSFLGSHTQVDFAQHVLALAGRSTTYKMNIQMRHPQSALYLGKGNSLGTLVLMVYAKLATIAGVDPVNIMLHASLDNAHVTTPRPCGAAIVENLGEPITTMADIKRLRQLETEARNAITTKLGFRTQASESTETMSKVVQNEPAPELNIETNTPEPSKQPNAITVGKLPGQKVKTNLTTRPVQYAQHFEDLAFNIDQMCKKYTQAYIKVVTVTQATNTIIDIGNDILFPNGLGTAEPQNGAGLIGWYGAMFRGFRGDIRLKLSFRVEDADVPQLQVLPEVFGYLNVSYPRLGTNGTGTSLQLLNTNANLFPQSIGPAMLTAGNPHQHNFIISQAVPEVVEVEIPFVHLGQFQLPPAYSGNINREPYNFGFLNLSLCKSNEEAAAVTVTIRINAAFGDAAHFGIPTFIPKVIIVPNLYPDYWYSAAPISQSDEDEKDIVIIKRQIRPEPVGVSRRQLGVMPQRKH